MVAQVLAVTIFIVMFLLIILDKFERHIVTLLCGGATILFVFGVTMRDPGAVWRTLNVRHIFTVDFWYESGAAGESTGGINWATIIFIAGMMIMVEGMAKAGFFRWLCMALARAVHYRVIPIFLTFMAMSFLLAMFIDSITVILFLAAVTVELAQLLQFNPIPMIISEIFCANLGGSATMCGDPPNIIIGTSLKYTFMDFITNTGLAAIIGLAAVMVYFYFAYRGELKTEEHLKLDLSVMPEPKTAVRDKRSFVISTVIFLCAVVLLITHAMTGMTVALIGVLIAAATLLTSGKHVREVLKGVDYKTLLFFVGLFIVVGGLEETGVLEVVASFIERISKGNVQVMMAIVIWVSAAASAVVDNIPFAATMIPVIKSLALASGIDPAVLAWALAMGTDIGGSATPIGASANVVGTSVAAKQGYPIGWGRYCRKAIPATVMVLLVTTICFMVRYF